MTIDDDIWNLNPDSSSLALRRPIKESGASLFTKNAEAAKSKRRAHKIHIHGLNSGVEDFLDLIKRAKKRSSHPEEERECGGQEAHGMDVDETTPSPPVVAKKVDLMSLSSILNSQGSQQQSQSDTPRDTQDAEKGVVVNLDDEKDSVGPVIRQSADSESQQQGGPDPGQSGDSEVEQGVVVDLDDEEEPAESPTARPSASPTPEIVDDSEEELDRIEVTAEAREMLQSIRQQEQQTQEEHESESEESQDEVSQDEESDSLGVMEEEDRHSRGVHAQVSPSAMEIRHGLPQEHSSAGTVPEDTKDIGQNPHKHDTPPVSEDNLIDPESEARSTYSTMSPVPSQTSEVTVPTSSSQGTKLTEPASERPSRSISRVSKHIKSSSLASLCSKTNTSRSSYRVGLSKRLKIESLHTLKQK